MSRTLRHLSLTAVALLTAAGSVSCGPDRGKSLNEMGHVSLADSMLYYTGQLKAYEYLREAMNDTALRSTEARIRFLQGVRQGYDDMQGNDSAYNLGIRYGVRMAVRGKHFENEFGFTFDKDILFQSMAYALLQEKDIDELAVQDKLYDVLHKLQAQQAGSVHRQAHQAVRAEAAKLGMKRLEDGLYYKELTPGAGPSATTGSVLSLQVNYSRPDGESLGMSSPQEVTVGNHETAPVLNEIYCRMRQGEHARFLTPAFRLYGNRCEFIGLKPADPVLIDIQVFRISPGTATDINADI